ncbi:MAG: hypothetical protein ACQEXJ_24285 [Myxococcota bacterium]
MMWLALGLSAWMVGGCSEELEGPQPGIEAPSVEADPAPVDPGIICRDQHVSSVALHGEGFSPVPIDVPDDPRTALPTVSLTRGLELDGTANAEPPEVVYNGDPDVPENASLLSWQSQSGMTLDVVPPCEADADCGDGFVCHPEAGVCARSAEDVVSGRMEEGVYDVTVTNANDNEAQSLGSLAVIGEPTLSELTPPVVCLAQGEREVALTGTRFLTIDDAEADVSVEGVDAPFAVDDGTFGGCTDIPHEGYDTLRYCSEGTITLPTDSVDVGYPSVRVNNPETAACGSRDEINLRVVPPPSIEAVAEVDEDQGGVAGGDGTVVCLAEGAREVVLHGTDFLEIDGDLPTVTLDGTTATSLSIDGCEDLPAQGLAVRRCTRLTVEVPTSLEADAEPYQPAIEITNPAPAGCVDTTDDRPTLLTIAPPPDVVEVVPPLVCIEDGDRELTIAGTDFLTIDGTTPEVSFQAAPGVAPTSVTAQECTTLDVGGKTVQRCDELLVTIAQDSLDLGQPDVTVTNPMPAGCSDTESGLVSIIEGPEIAGATPALVCTDDAARAVTIEGSGFLDVDGTLPTVTMDGSPVTVDAVGGCQPVTVNGLAVQQCDTLDVTVAQGTLSEGDTEIVVDNPQPAGCSISDTTALTVPPAVAITNVDPIGVCAGSAGAEKLTIRGAGFLTVDGADFELTIGGDVVVPDDVGDCTTLDVDGMSVESCSTITATYDFTGMAAGAIPIGVTNPAPSGCGTLATDLFQISPPPTVTEVQPSELCSDVPSDELTLIGTDFASNATVALTGAETGEQPPTSVTVVSETQIDLTFADGLPADTYDITVSNGADCESSLTAGLIVHPTPLVFFVDPPVVYNGITTEVTVHSTGLDQAAAEVALIDDSGDAIPLESFANPDPEQPNRILAEVPAELDAGSYEVSVTSIHDCVSSLHGTLAVTDSLTLDLAGIDPAFASPTLDTAVTVFADSPPGAGLVDFVPVPRVYLNPSTDPDATATAVDAVVLEDPGTLNGIVPGGLTPGVYDVIAVNPTGEVGVLSEGLTVTEVEPPFVTAVAPASVDSNTTGQEVTVVGQNFGTDPAEMGVTLDCRDFETGQPAASNGAVTVDAASPTELDVTVDTTGVSDGTVCVVVVTNPDGSSYRFSALSVKEPAQNLNPWAFGPSLQEPRRAPAVATGRPTDRSRFLYAVGGDDGAEEGAKATIESSPIGVFGGMGDWVHQRNDLSAVMSGGAPTPAPRTFGELVRVGEFLYLTGGHDGISSVASVLRARVLRPQDAPEVLDLDAELGDGTVELGSGIWYYRVAAVFPDDDPYNPGGETLPGEVLTVQLPDIPEGIVLTLDWESVPGASGYRVYRTPVADDTATNLQLVGTTDGQDATTLVDGGLAADDTETPLPQGSLGVWHEVASMGTPRSAHASVAVTNPADPAEVWLYAAGGRDADGAAVATGEFATISIGADGTQTLGAWQPLTASLASARAELGGFVVTSADTNIVGPAAPLVYFSQGRTDTSLSTDFEVGVVEPGGDIVALGDVSGPTPPRAGGTDLAANGWLFILGGSNGSASNGNDTSSEVVQPDGTLGTWDALGDGALLQALIHMGSAKESAFFFIVGGWDGSAPVAAVEQTIQ